MTTLSEQVLRILEVEDEGPRPLLSAESLSRVLWCTGFGETLEPIPAATIEGALEELLKTGKIERVHSARVGPRYRVLRSAQVGNVKA